MNSVFPSATANMEGDGIRGTVDFFQKTNGVLVKADISGLPESNEAGFFGFHVHKGGSCEGAGFPEAGSHYDRDDNPHPRHSGDMPPLLSNGGRAYLAFMTNRFSVDEIIGKTVIIHGMPDDFHTQPSGDSGEKIACGVIRKL